jgi:hypothetical protein
MKKSPCFFVVGHSFLKLIGFLLAFDGCLMVSAKMGATILNLWQ